MINWIFFMIYWGGAVSNWDEKRGFWLRVFWPMELGEALYIWARGK